MINVDTLLKVMRADLPVNFDKGILASELGNAKSWYQTRSKLDKWPKRETIVSRFITDTKRYHAALGELCQSAFKFDPVSASNFDPFERRGLAVALASSELAGVAETWRARAA